MLTKSKILPRLDCVDNLSLERITRPRLKIDETTYRRQALENLTKKKIIEIVKKYELAKDIARLLPNFRKERLHYTKYRKGELITLLTYSFIVEKLKDVEELKINHIENEYDIDDDTWVFTMKKRCY
jgi:hypothetical protein